MKEVILVVFFLIVWTISYLVAKKPGKVSFYSHTELSKRLLESQQELDDNFIIESSTGDIKESRECKKLFKYLNHRRKKVNKLVKIIDKLHGY